MKDSKYKDQLIDWSIANIDQHRIRFPMVHNTIGFAKETNLPFMPWSRDAFFESQWPKNVQKSAVGFIAKIDQHKILFPLTPNLVGFVNEIFSPISRHAHVTNRYQQKMYTIVFKSGHVLEQYPKTKFRVKQSIRCLEHIPCLKGWMNSLIRFSQKYNLLHLLCSIWIKRHLPLIYPVLHF